MLQQHNFRLQQTSAEHAAQAAKYYIGMIMYSSITSNRNLLITILQRPQKQSCKNHLIQTHRQGSKDRESQAGRQSYGYGG